MHIHTVKAGESIFGISKEYAVSPLSIIQNNGLENPDSLTVGQKLLILIPSRSYTARSGDTVSSIARRFGIRKNEIYANNPALLGSEKLYEGQPLALRYGDTRIGMAASNGYLFKGCTEEELSRALPYLTYVTVASATADRGGIKKIFDAGWAVDKIRTNGKIPMLRIYDEGDGEIYSNEDACDVYITALINLAHAEKYSGLTLSTPSESVKKDEYEAFIIRLRKRLIGSDLILFTECSLGRECGYADYADGCILSYEKLLQNDTVSFDNGERHAFTGYAESSESSKTFMDITSFALIGDGYADYKDAQKTANRVGAEIMTDMEGGYCYYDYYERGGNRVSVKFESPENIKAKLELLGELGYMGISFDIMRCPIEHLMMYNALFSEVCYTSVFSSDS